MTFGVELDEEAEEQTATITLRSLNDCPFTIVDGKSVPTCRSFSPPM